MTKNILLFLTFPLFIFATIEVAQKPTPKKSQEKVTEQRKKAPQKTPVAPQTETTIDDDSDELPSPEATTPPFLDTGYQKQFFRTLIFICIFILFAMIVIFIYKRASPMSTIAKRNSRNNIKILERRSLSPQTFLYHIQIGDKQFVLAESKVDVRNVADLDWPERK